MMSYSATCRGDAVVSVHVRRRRPAALAASAEPLVVGVWHRCTTHERKDCRMSVKLQTPQLLRSGSCDPLRDATTLCRKLSKECRAYSSA